MKHKNDDDILKNKGTDIYRHYKVYLNLQKIFVIYNNSTWKLVEKTRLTQH